MLRFSLFSSIAALALVVAPLMSASAGQKNYAPTYQNCDLARLRCSRFG